jgi:putative peptidoglycan lipid II flippase
LNEKKGKFTAFKNEKRMQIANRNIKAPGKKTFPTFVAITLFTFINAFINYLTITMLAYFFGAGIEIDAFFAATTLPLVIIAILQVIIPNTFIPVFINIKKQDETNSWRVASIMTNLIFVILAIIAIIGVTFSKTIITLINPGFSTSTAARSSALFSYLILSLVFSGTAIILSSIYYAQKKFIRPLLAQTVSSSIILFFVLLFHNQIGLKSIAMGTLAGSIIQFGILHSVLLRRRRYSPSFDFRKKEIIALFALMLPLLLGALFYKMNIVVERFITSRLAPGSVAYLGYAGKINAALLLFLTQGISITLFQRLSEHSAVMDFSGLQETLSRGLRAMILLTTPFVFLMVFAGNDLVRLAFQRGNFTPQATRTVSVILLAYLGYFVVNSVGVPVVNTLYSLQLTTTISVVGASGFILFIFFALILSQAMGCKGIALAASIQSFISITCFLWIAVKKIGGIQFSPILRCTQKAILAACASVIAIIPLRAFLHEHTAPNLEFLFSAGTAFCVYAGILLVLRTEELAFISKRFLRRG